MKHIAKALVVSFVLSFVLSAVCSAADLDQSIAAAKRANKKLFIMFGRQACGNCQHLKKMIRDGSVKISNSEFIVVDMNCDDKVQSQAFYKRYTVNGNYLPFVVIARPDGTQITSRAGYGEASDYNNLIKGAK
ncbi:MAG: thioredoxin family protein [Candidatus Omnitrophota bacterium]